jgi:chromosome segregation ATPase
MRWVMDRLKRLQDLESDLMAKEAEIERLQKAYRPADMIEYQELVAEIERLRADNELLSKLNQEYGAEIERLRERVENLRARNNALYEAIDILKRGGKLK